jgi:predicted metalloprotease
VRPQKDFHAGLFGIIFFVYYVNKIYIMKWFGGKESDDVEEGSSGGGIGGRHIALGGGVVGVICFVIYLFTGVNPAQFLNGGNSGDSQQVSTPVNGGTEDRQTKFARVIFQGTEDVWDSLFNAEGKHFTHPVLHFYSGEVDAQGCGMASSATGPFYCPADQKIYLDLSFFQELRDRFQSPGEMAEAYVIAHEFGHHIQNLLGVSAKMEEARRRLSDVDYNKLSVKLELQADYYAGVWAHYESKYNQNGISIDRSDIDSALVAAHAIGDDRLQQQSTGRVEPDSFTHGTSAQRAYWFTKGFETGDVNGGTTFAAGDLVEN